MQTCIPFRKGYCVATHSKWFGKRDPVLWSFTRGETEYRLSALPFGGYVQMYGDDVTEEVPASEEHRSFLHQPFPKKAAIAAAVAYLSAPEMRVTEDEYAVSCAATFAETAPVAPTIVMEDGAKVANA